MANVLLDASTIGSTIIGALKSGLNLIGDLATGVKDAIVRMFCDGSVTEAGVFTPTNISTAGIIILVFGGIALAFGLTKLAFHMLRSKIG